MRVSHLILAAALTVVVPAAGSAQTPAPGAKPTESGTPEKAARRRPSREPTAGQMAARERQRTCGAEWKVAKAAGKTAGTKWPQFWSQCNARLKGSHV